MCQDWKDGLNLGLARCAGFQPGKEASRQRKLFKSAFLNCILKNTGHAREMLYEIASLTNKFWTF